MKHRQQQRQLEERSCFYARICLTTREQVSFGIVLPFDRYTTAADIVSHVAWNCVERLGMSVNRDIDPNTEFTLAIREMQLAVPTATTPPPRQRVVAFCGDAVLSETEVIRAYLHTGVDINLMLLPKSADEPPHGNPNHRTGGKEGGGRLYDATVTVNSSAGEAVESPSRCRNRNERVSPPEEQQPLRRDVVISDLSLVQSQVAWGRSTATVSSERSDCHACNSNSDVSPPGAQTRSYRGSAKQQHAEDSSGNTDDVLRDVHKQLFELQNAVVVLAEQQQQDHRELRQQRSPQDTQNPKRNVAVHHYVLYDAPDDDEEGCDARHIATATPVEHHSGSRARDEQVALIHPLFEPTVVELSSVL